MFGGGQIMQVTVESMNEFSHRMTVTVKVANIERDLQNELSGMLPTVKISGFRQGKVPLRMVKNVYGESTRFKIINSFIKDSMREIVTHNKINIAGEPRIETIKEDDQDVIYTIIYEVFPDVQEVKIGNLHVDKIVSSVQETDVLTMLNELREQHSSWEPLKLAAKIKNVVKIDYYGSIDGKKFDCSDGCDVLVVIGSGSMPPKFEQQLVGKKAGDKTFIHMIFPDNCHDKSLQGQDVNFEVTVQSVAERKSPTLDDGFAVLCGYSGGVAELKKEVVSNMESELTVALNIKNKKKIMEMLTVSNELTLPEIFIDHEARHLMEQENHNLIKQGINADKVSFDIDNFKNLAKERVSLSLLINKIVHDNKIRPDRDRVKLKIDSIAAKYKNPEDIVSLCMKSEENLLNIEMMVIEEQVVELIYKHAKVETISLTFSDAMSFQLALQPNHTNT